MQDSLVPHDVLVHTWVAFAKKSWCPANVLDCVRAKIDNKLCAASTKGVLRKLNTAVAGKPLATDGGRIWL